MKGFQKREIWFNENVGRKLIRCYKDFNRLGATLEKWFSLQNWLKIGEQTSVAMKCKGFQNVKISLKGNILGFKWFMKVFD